MTGELLVVGVDPGLQPGVVALRWSDTLLVSAEAIQCNAGVAPGIVEWLLGDVDFRPGLRAVVQTERFVVGRASGKSGKAGAVTRDLVGAVERTVAYFTATSGNYPAVTVQENAARVKAWATDIRLAAAAQSGGTNLLELTKGMTHSRDGARHALFASVNHGGVPDPLSKSVQTGAPR